VFLELKKEKRANMQTTQITEADIKDYYIRFGPRLFRRCLNLLGDEEKAMDAVQEVFIKVMLNRKKLHNSFPSRLLYRISTNICLNIIRAQNIRQEAHKKSQILAEIATGQHFETRFLMRDRLDRIFQNENSLTREIAVMFFVEEFSQKEISDMVGLSLSGVGKRLRMLRKRMKQEKEDRYDHTTNP
jgi:RNA polymerase sigma-70 factor (ECF subfamily)